MEALKNPTPNAPVATINYTHHTTLINLVELFNSIPKVVEQQSTDRHNIRRSEVLNTLEQTCAKVIHKYPTRQQQNQVPTPRVKTQTRRPDISPTVELSETHMETTEKRKPGKTQRVTANQALLVTQ